MKELGEWENTVLIFTSDNGGLSVHSRAGQDDRNAPLRAGKGSFYEGGIRVPLMVRRPYQESLTVHQPVVGTDLFALVLYEAGLRNLRTEDADLARLFNRFSGDKPIVWHMPHFWGVKGQGVEPFSALRLGDMKLAYRHRDQRFELYDLMRDLGETRDLAMDMPDQVAELAGVLGRELREMGAQMPTMKDGGVGCALAGSGGGGELFEIGLVSAGKSGKFVGVDEAVGEVDDSVGSGRRGRLRWRV